MSAREHDDLDGHRHDLTDAQRDILEREREQDEDEHARCVEDDRLARECGVWRVRAERLAAELADQIRRWSNLPSGVDEDAREDDPSPADAAAHAAGLAIRAARAALAELPCEDT